MTILRSKPTAAPVTVEEQNYKGLTIEMELHRIANTDHFYVWPYIKQATVDGPTKQWFRIEGNDFATKEGAVKSAVEQGKKAIDAGFVVGQMGDDSSDIWVVKWFDNKTTNTHGNSATQSVQVTSDDWFRSDALSSGKEKAEKYAKEQEMLHPERGEYSVHKVPTD